MNMKKNGLKFTEDAIIAWLNLGEQPYCMAGNHDFSEVVRCHGPDALVAELIEKGTDEEELFRAVSEEYGLKEQEYRDRFDTLLGYFREMEILVEAS